MWLQQVGLRHRLLPARTGQDRVWRQGVVDKKGDVVVDEDGDGDSEQREEEVEVGGEGLPPARSPPCLLRLLAA